MGLRVSFRRDSVLGPLLRWFDQDEAHKTGRMFVLALLVLGSGLGMRDPWPPNEPMLALMMRDLASGGHWLIPHLAGQPFSEHPPLVIWLGALIMQFTGSLRLGFQLPSLLAAMGTIWLTYDIGRKLWGARAGRLSALVLLCAFQFSLQAHTGQVDMVFAFFVTLGLYGFLRYLLLAAELRWLIYAGAGIGLGMLTKGAGYLAALVLLPWLWMRIQRWPELPPRPGLRKLWPAALTAVVLVAIWALPALAFVEGADTAALNQFRRDLTVNLLGGADLLLGGAVEPLWYLPLQALLLWMPLTLLLPWLMPIWRQRMRDRDPRSGLLIGYILAIFALFTALPGRHGAQVLPALPALALLVGANLGGTWWKPGVQWMSRGVLIGIGLALLIMVALARLRSPTYGLLLPPDTPFGLYWGVGVLGLIALILALAFRFGSRNQALALPVFIGIGWFLMGWGVYPWLNNIRTPESLMDKAAETLAVEDAEVRIGMFDWRAQFPLFSDIAIEGLDDARPEESLSDWCQQKGVRAVLLPDRLWAESGVAIAHLVDTPESLGVRHSRDWLIARCADKAGKAPTENVGSS